MVGLSAIVFAVGWKIGTLHGMEASYLMNESARTIVVANELQLIRDNKIDSLLQNKEMELDLALFSYVLYEEENPSWTAYPLNRMADASLERAVLYAAKYRKNYPDNEHRIDPSGEMTQVYSRVDRLLETAGKQN